MGLSRLGRSVHVVCVLESLFCLTIGIMTVMTKGAFYLFLFFDIPTYFWYIHTHA